MILPGRLRATTLGDVLGALHRAGVTGTLELVEVGAPARHFVHFERGLVNGVQTSRGRVPLGELLARDGLVARERLVELATWQAALPHKRIGRVLVERGITSPTLVCRALRRQCQRQLEALFEIADAEVRFHAPRPRGRSDGLAPLGPDEFLYGRRRAREGQSPAPAAEASSRGRPSRIDSERARALRVLGIREGADARSVARAFRKLAAEAHPDRHPWSSDAETHAFKRRFVELSAAYHYLARG
jgi:hypothetical protein